jgi:8-oxo-dGTP pyrophosphatase MutT (NUDIX family)
MERTVVDAGTRMSSAEHIRPIVVCVCRRGERILVFEGRDSVKQQTFYRPLGGGIEFGERGEEGVRREFREELGAELLEVHFLGMLGNVFTCEGRRGHEIVLVFDGRLAEASLYEKEVFAGDEEGTPFRAMWKSLDEFGPGKAPLYPDGLLELLKG